MMPLFCSLAISAIGLADHPLVLFEHRLLDPDVVVPLARDRAAGDLDLPLDHLLVQLLPDRRVGIGAQLLLVRREQDRVPGRRAAEHLACCVMLKVCVVVFGEHSG